MWIIVPAGILLAIPWLWGACLHKKMMERRQYTLNHPPEPPTILDSIDNELKYIQDTERWKDAEAKADKELRDGCIKAGDEAILNMLSGSDLS